MIVGLLGILKAGAAYLPLDPDYPAERLGFMLSDSRTCLLVTSSALRRQFDGHEVPILCLDAEQAALTVEPATMRPIVALSPQHPAYVIYTSGSTGRPKGVVVSHAAVANLMRAIRPYILSSRDVVHCNRSISFDAAIWEIRSYPCSRRAAHSYAAAGSMSDLRHVRDLIASQAITHRSLYQHAAPSGCTELPAGPDASLVVGGEAVSRTRS